MSQSGLGFCFTSVCDLLKGGDNSTLHPLQMRLGEQVCCLRFFTSLALFHPSGLSPNVTSSASCPDNSI